jgi:serine/threonine protein kinase
MKVDTEAMHKHLKDEVRLTSQMCHDRIVRLLAACLNDKDNICLIMELIENGNLSKRIHNRKLRKMEYLKVLQVGFDIAEGLSYLHPSIIHRDLKPQNVLLDKDSRAKIADFGISKFKDPHRSYLSVTQTGGTPNYMAPELFNGTRVDEKCDIYSLGCILYEAMTRRVPLSDLPSDNCAPLFQIIKTVAIDKRRPKIPEFFPHGLAELIRQCWKDNPRSRPSASEACLMLEDLIEREIERIEQARQAQFELSVVHLSNLPNNNSSSKRTNRGHDLSSLTNSSTTSEKTDISSHGLFNGTNQTE